MRHSLHKTMIDTYITLQPEAQSAKTIRIGCKQSKVHKSQNMKQLTDTVVTNAHGQREQCSAG